MKIYVLRQALLKKKKVDFRFSQHGLKESEPTFTRAEVLSLEVTDGLNISAVIKIEGNKTAQLVSWLTIKDVRISEGVTFLQFVSRFQI